MHAIHIHLEPAEAAVISRYAKALDVSPKDIAYAGLDQLMSRANDPATRQSVKDCREWRRENLPIWADTERSVHAYEGAPDDQPEENLHF